jgi:hypothetical protein
MMTNSKFKIQNSKFILTLFTFLTFNFLLAESAPAQISSGGSFSLEKSVMPGGGGSSTAGGFTVTGTAGQNTAGNAAQNGNFSLTGGFWSPDQLAPTSASVSVSGKVTTLNGRGIRNVIVTLTDNEGNVQTTFTGSFGSYRFTDVEVGQTYILQVQAKKYLFPNPVQVVTINDELTNMDFTAED